MTSAGPSHHQWHVSCMCSKWAFLPFCKKNKLELDPNKHDRKNNNPCRGLILKTADLSTPKPACAVDRSRSPSLIPRGQKILNLRTFHSKLLCGDHRAVPSACAGHCQRPFPDPTMIPQGINTITSSPFLTEVNKWLQVTTISNRATFILHTSYFWFMTIRKMRIQNASYCRTQFLG